MLEAESLTKSFGGVAAVSHVSFEVPTGQWLGIIGPNGAGKTTLFNLLSGQLRPSDGRIRLEGKDITSRSPHERFHMGMARSFQIASLFPRLTVLDHFALALRRKHRSSLMRGALSDRRLRAEMAEAMASWDLDGLPAYTLPDELSYGEQRRVELALAVSSSPKLLLLDEPNVGLTTAECDDLLTRVRRIAEDVTVIFIAHDMEMVLGWSHRVLVMHFGELIADETPQALLENESVSELYLGRAREDCRA